MTGSLPNPERSKMRLFGRTLVLVYALLLFGHVPCSGQMDEYSIKAGFLYNFTKYVEWPEASFAESNSFVICIAGEDPFEGRLDQVISGRTAGNGRPLTVKHLDKGTTGNFKGCQLLFVSKSERRRANEIISAVEGNSVFTVADFSPFAEMRGGADLRIEGNKVKVDLNVSAAIRANLKVSGRLQQVANLVSETK